MEVLCRYQVQLEHDPPSAGELINQLELAVKAGVSKDATAMVGQGWIFFNWTEVR